MGVFVCVTAAADVFSVFPSGVYSENYDPALAHCNVTVWNPEGSGLSYEEFDFPIFSLKDDNDTQVIRQVNTTAEASRYFVCESHLHLQLQNCSTWLSLYKMAVKYIYF